MIDQRVTTAVATIHEQTLAMNQRIANHTNFDAADYAYLHAKDWTDEEILARWDAEAARGAGPCGWEAEVARAKLDNVAKRR